jgi:PhzF family phenazine biosynthesis protein
VPLEYVHLDVFAPAPYSGNSVTVFPNAAGLGARQMARITAEMRHFESIFLVAEGAADTVRARVFDLLEELRFAGHPVLGAAVALHDAAPNGPSERTWTVRLPARTVQVETVRTELGYLAWLSQGPAEVVGRLPGERRAEFAAALGLTEADLAPDFPLEVVSTGLRYLIVPVVGALARARIVRADFAELLATVGAEFAYLLDVANPAHLEGRHWNNDGVVEDVATGSGAGCVGAYALRNGLARADSAFTLHQGRLVGRPSEIVVRAEGSAAAVTNVVVGGPVTPVGRGCLTALPDASEEG